MFFRKLVAILLLGFYGIPAALGPHWHRHDCGNHSHEATACTIDSSEQTASGDKAQAAPSTGHHCCCHHHHAAAASQAEASPARPTDPVVSATDEHGDCAICAFYASAQQQPTSFAIAFSSQQVCLCNWQTVLVSSATPAAWHARGPPA